MAGVTTSRLGAIAATRWGMFTAAQASNAGVSRKVLSGLAAAGAIDRLAQGVYRMAGAPVAEIEIDVVRISWLAVGGAAGESVVASGKSAAVLHRIGDWFPTTVDFVTPTRRTTRLQDVRLRVRQLDEGDIVHVDGIPSMTVERAIADLVESWEDPSLIADALLHAVQRGVLLRPRRLAQLLEPFAYRNQARSGVALAERLMAAGGVEDSWRARLQ
ncbi:type IV toxin-antitoxin system AbiEi family antitoxin domain-containing protein [Microbacterium sp. A588]